MAAVGHSLVYWFEVTRAMGTMTDGGVTHLNGAVLSVVTRTEYFPYPSPLSA